MTLSKIIINNTCMLVDKYSDGITAVCILCMALSVILSVVIMIDIL